MAAVFGGIARAPFTSIVFLFELSRNPNALLPLVVCCMVSDGVVGLFSAESIMTGKLIKRGLIVRQDYSVAFLMRARIEQVMRKNFAVVPAEAQVESVVRDVISPENTGLLPVVERDGRLVGIVEAHDLLRSSGKNLQMREIARQNYVLARPGDTVDAVTRLMLARESENVVVVEEKRDNEPIGVVRAADILRLRRWTLEEESHESPNLSAQVARPLDTSQPERF